VAPITTPLNVLGNSFSFIGGEGTGDILGPITGISGGIGGDGDILSPITGIIGGVDGEGDILSTCLCIIGGIGG
ncbi:hypothetical protein, partial [Acinetobacter baumannii]|uniref:hypothetical protein n=1 Tax=Acinetobacter baumannii TaxID=470 RepID=UPI000E1A862B